MATTVVAVPATAVNGAPAQPTSSSTSEATAPSLSSLVSLLDRIDDALTNRDISSLRTIYGIIDNEGKRLGAIRNEKAALAAAEAARVAAEQAAAAALAPPVVIDPKESKRDKAKREKKAAEAKDKEAKERSPSPAAPSSPQPNEDKRGTKGAKLSRKELKAKADAAAAAAAAPVVLANPIGTATSELFIMCAEAAIMMGDFAMASSCLTMFYDNDPPSKNQFACRALLARATVEANKTNTLRGDELANGIMGAINHCMTVVDIINERGDTLARGQSHPYAFVIHNTAVVYRAISRALLRDGLRAQLSSSMARLVETMETYLIGDEQDAPSYINYLIDLSSCYDEAEESDEASKQIGKALALCKKPTGAAINTITSELKDRVLRHAVHINRNNQRALDTVGTDLDGKVNSKTGALENEYIVGARGIYIVQKIKSGCVKADDIEKQLIAALTAVDYQPDEPEPVDDKKGGGAASSSGTTLAAGSTTATRRASKSPRKGRKPTSKRNGDAAAISSGIGPGSDAQKLKAQADMLSRLAVVAEVARLALVAGLYPLVDHCLSLTRTARRFGVHKCGLLSEFTAVQLAVLRAETRPLPAASFKGDVGIDALRQRIDALKVLDQAIGSAVRLADAEIIQDGCVLVWNLALPLLQPDHRSHVHRVFKTCVYALELVASSMHQLRVQFHLELAKCEVDSDYLAKATIDVDKALLLDYTVTPSPPKDDDKEPAVTPIAVPRPYDRILYPLQSKLEVKQNLYNDPDTLEEQALLGVEQCKDTRTQPYIIPNLLLKATHLLATKEDENKMDNRRKSLRASLWYDIARMAWANKIVDMTIDACRHVLDMKWDYPRVTGDKEYMIQQGETHLIMAHVSVYQLSSLGLRPGEVGYTLPTLTMVKGEDEKEREEEERAKKAQEEQERDRTKPKKPTLLLKSQRKAEEEATKAAELATSSSEWQTKLYASITGAIAMGKVLREDYLVMNSVVLAWNIHLHVFTLQQLPSLSVNPLSPAVKDALLGYYRSLLSIPSRDISLICKLACTLARSMEYDRSYEQGIEVCQSALPVAGLREKRDLLAIFARLYKKMNQTPPIPTDRETRALGLLELLRSPLSSPEEKKSLLSQIVKTLADPSAQAAKDAAANDGKRTRGGNDRKARGRSGGRERDSSTGKKDTAGTTGAPAKRKPGASGRAGAKGSRGEDAAPTGLGLVMSNNGMDDEEEGSLDVRALMSQRAIDEELEEKRTATLDIECELWAQVAIEALAIGDLPVAVACAYQTLSALPSSTPSTSAGDRSTPALTYERPITASAGLTTRPGTAASVISVTSNVTLDDTGSGSGGITSRAPASHTALALGAPAMMEKNMKTVTAQRWRWYSLAACVYGEATVRLIDGEKHDKSNQDAIRSAAIHHFQRCAQFAKLSLSRAKYHQLVSFDTAPSAQIVLRAAQHFWNTAIPLTHSALTRRVLRRPLASLVTSLDYAVDIGGFDSLEPAFRQNLYMLLLEAIRDDEDWQAGFTATTSALKRLPPQLRQTIWEVRVLFMSKLGMNVASGVLKMKDKDPSVRAKVWSSLAKSCPNRLDQFNFYQKAIHAVEHPIDKVDYLVEYGEWLYVSNFPVADAEDQLYLAADILHDVEPDTLELEEEARSVMGSTMASQFGGSMSKRQARAKAKKPNSSARGSIGGATPSVMGSRAGQRSSQSRRQSMDAASRASFNAKGGASLRGSASGTGGAGGTIQIQMPDRLNVKHLCTLVRIYSMLAMMARTLSRRAELSLVCQHYIVRMWETAIEAANLIIIARAERERILKKDAELKAGTTTTTISLNVPGMSNNASNAAPLSPGSPSGGSFPPGMTRITAPKEVHEWITFIPSVQLRDCFRGDRSRSSMTINRHTIHRPDVLVHYLQWLNDTLQQFGYHMQCLPVYALIDLIGTDILSSRALVSLTHLRVARLYDQLNLVSECRARLEKAEPILPTEAEMAIYREEVEQCEQLKALSVQQQQQASLTESTSGELGETKTTESEPVATTTTVVVAPPKTGVASEEKERKRRGTSRAPTSARGSSSSPQRTGRLGTANGRGGTDGNISSSTAGNVSGPVTTLIAPVSFETSYSTSRALDDNPSPSPTPGGGLSVAVSARGIDGTTGNATKVVESIASSGGVPPVKGKAAAKIINGLSIRELWIQTASLLIDMTRLPQAKTLLLEARRHCEAYDDAEGLALCRRHFSRIAILEGNPQRALKLEYGAQRFAGDLMFWRSAIDWLMTCVMQTSRRNVALFQSLHTRQTSMIKRAIATFDNLSRDPELSSGAMEATRCVADLQCSLAVCMTSDDLWDRLDHSLYGLLTSPFAPNAESLDGLRGIEGLAEPAYHGVGPRLGTNGPAKGRLGAPSRGAPSVTFSAANPSIGPQVSSLGTGRASVASRAGVSSTRHERQNEEIYFRDAFALFEQSEKTMLALQDHPQLIRVLRQHARARLRYFWLTYHQQQSAPHGVEVTEHVLTALELLTRADEHASHRVFSVRPPVVEPPLSLPASRELAAIKTELASCYLLIHWLRNPPRIYIPPPPLQPVQITITPAAPPVPPLSFGLELGGGSASNLLLGPIPSTNLGGVLSPINSVGGVSTAGGGLSAISEGPDSLRAQRGTERRLVQSMSMATTPMGGMTSGNFTPMSATSGAGGHFSNWPSHPHPFNRQGSRADTMSIMSGNDSLGTVTTMGGRIDLGKRIADDKKQKEQEASLHQLFFSRYERVFGSDTTPKDFSAATRAVVLSSSALTLDGIPAGAARLHLHVGEALSAQIRERREQREDEQKRRDDIDKGIALDHAYATTGKGIIAPVTPNPPAATTTMTPAMQLVAASNAAAAAAGMVVPTTPSASSSVGSPLLQTHSLLQRKGSSTTPNSAQAAAAVASGASLAFSTSPLGITSNDGDRPASGAPAVPLYPDFSYDKSIWSPQLLVSWLTANRNRFALLTQLQTQQQSEAEGKTKGSKKGGAALPKQKSTMSSSSETKDGAAEGTSEKKTARAPMSKAAAAAAAAALAAELQQQKDEVWPDTPFASEAEDVRLCGQAVEHLSKAITMDHMEGLCDITSGAALTLANIYGTSRPLDAALLLHLHISAELRVYAYRVFNEAAAIVNPEALVMQRKHFLRQHTSIDSKESRTVNNFLALHSLINKRTSLTVNHTPEDDIDDEPSTSSSTGSGTRPAFIRQQQSLLSSLPPSTLVLTLYYNPYERCIYTTLVSSTAQDATRVSRVTLTHSQEARLTNLFLVWAEFQTSLQRRVLLFGHNKSPQLELCVMQFGRLQKAMVDALGPAFHDALLSDLSFKDQDVILICDRLFFSLPLETLPIFALARSVSRDFSLHMLHHRIVAQQDASINRGKLSYVVDSHREDASGGTTALMTRISTPATAGAASKGMIWNGISGVHHAPVPGEWQRLVTNHSCFMYFGFERFAARFAPENIAALNLSDLSLVVLNDRATNEVSHRRQSKLNNQKRGREKELESSYNVALLLSLRGVNTIVCHQYAISAEVNAAEVLSFWDAMYQGHSVGACVHKWRRPDSVAAAAITSTITSSTPKTEEKKRLGVRPAGSGAAAAAAVAAGGGTTIASTAMAQASPTNSSGGTSQQRTSSPPAMQRLISGSKMGGATGYFGRAGSIVVSREPGIVEPELIRAYDRFNTIVYGCHHITLS